MNGGALSHLEDIRDELMALLPLYEDAMKEATNEKDSYDSLYGQTFLDSHGAVETRKIVADQTCRKQGLKPDVSAAVVRRIEKRISVLERVGDFDRTLAASERAVT